MRSYFVGFVIIGVLFASIGACAFAICGIYAMVSAGHTARQAYYVQCVSEMIIFHLDANDGQWPKQWGDLRDDKAKCGTLGGWTLDELEQNVSIDWEANVADLKRAASKNGEPPFRVVWSTDGTNAYWSGQEPNQEIHRYLKGERSTMTLPNGEVPRPIEK